MRAPRPEVHHELDEVDKRVRIGIEQELVDNLAAELRAFGPSCFE